MDYLGQIGGDEFAARGASAEPGLIPRARQTSARPAARDPCRPLASPRRVACSSKKAGGSPIDNRTSCRDGGQAGRRIASSEWPRPS